MRARLLYLLQQLLREFAGGGLIELRVAGGLQVGAGVVGIAEGEVGAGAVVEDVGVVGGKGLGGVEGF